VKRLAIALLGVAVAVPFILPSEAASPWSGPRYAPPGYGYAGGPGYPPPVWHMPWMGGPGYMPVGYGYAPRPMAYGNMPYGYAPRPMAYGNMPYGYVPRPHGYGAPAFARAPVAYPPQVAYGGPHYGYGYGMPGYGNGFAPQPYAGGRYPTPAWRGNNGYGRPIPSAPAWRDPRMAANGYRAMPPQAYGARNVWRLPPRPGLSMARPQAPTGFRPDTAAAGHWPYYRPPQQMARQARPWTYIPPQARYNRYRPLESDRRSGYDGGPMAAPVGNQAAAAGAAPGPWLMR